MSISEKAAYLKGLADGLKLGDSDKDRMFKAIIDVIDDIAQTVDDINEDLDCAFDQIDAVDEDLADLEDFVYEGPDFDEHYHDFCDDDCCCDDDLYEIDCPACGETFNVDGEILEDGSVECPACGELLEFDFDEADDEEDDQ